MVRRLIYNKIEAEQAGITDHIEHIFELGFELNQLNPKPLGHELIFFINGYPGIDHKECPTYMYILKESEIIKSKERDDSTGDYNDFINKIFP